MKKKTKKEPTGVQLGPRFEAALVYACQAHAGQLRKQTPIPYVSHLLAVTALALEAGATEDEAIAAVLHDVVEDAGGHARLTDVRDRFGPQVAEIVAGCTDAYETPKPPWAERKAKYLEHLRSAPPAVKLISAADKLHNLRAILADYGEIKEAVWKKFNGGREGTWGYYGNLARIYRESITVEPRLRLVSAEIDRVLAELGREAGFA